MLTEGDIPCLSLAQAESASFCAQLRNAFSEFGFVALVDHGLTPGLRTRAFGEMARFFSQTEEEKRRVYRPGQAGARGYTPFGVEMAKDQSIADLKEFFHVGREQVRLVSGQKEASLAQRQALHQLPGNIWPDGHGSFRAALSELYQALDDIGARVLRSIALGLDLEASHFEHITDVGNSLLRALHYPKIPSQCQGAVRAAAHEDINLITLLVGSEQPGLEVLSRSGRWIAAPSGDEFVICNVGDMLQRLTNYVLVSTTHRVVNPPAPWSEQSRYSVPFFLHPNSNFLIRSLPTCVSTERPDRFPEPILANDFLSQRLAEIGLL